MAARDARVSAAPSSRRGAALETEHKHLATKADLEKGLSGVRTELHATETRLSKEAQENKEELRKEVQAVRKEAQENKEELQTEMRKIPSRIVVGMAGLATIIAFGPQAIEWLRRLFG